MSEVAVIVDVITVEIIKIIPEISTWTAVSVQKTESGTVSWTTVVYTNTQTNKTMQVTTICNKTTGSVQVVDHKYITVLIPEIKVVTISNVAIETAITKVVEIKTVVSEIKTTYATSVIDSIQVETFGTIQKISVVFIVDSKKIDVQYMVNMTTKAVTLIETVHVSETIKAEFYYEESNKYGEITVTSSNVSAVVIKVPSSSVGVQWIITNYPAIEGKPVEAIKVIEYSEVYQLTYVSQIDSENSIVVVVEINKKTNVTVEVSTYTKEDITTNVLIKPAVVTVPVYEVLPTDQVEVIKIVEYL